jgi:cytochrome c553
MRWLPALCVALLPTAAPAADPPKPTAAEVEFFEKKVRPVLADHCHSCHGPKKQSAGLRLDTAAGLRAGADNGPVVVPGDPAKSRLIASVKREGEYAMPPKAALPAEAVAVLVEWVKGGAAFPEAAAVTPAADPRKHWAFQPVKEPRVPTTGHPIDALVKAKLDAAGLKPAPPADKRTLIRRAYYDLTGLPPTAAEVQAFEADADPAAWEKLIDRLLASPHYGERWGRYWLDLARYADTKGYILTEDRNFPFAYTYRDYVVRSLNEDKPYDRFVTEQLAADRLPLGDDKRPLAALGFLTLGRRFLNNTHDIIDDRIDVVTRGLMGLTVTCARCHDHKYDPVPAADYYSLYGVFASSQEPKELPLIGTVARTPEVEAFEAEVAKRDAQYAAEREKRHAATLKKLREPAAVAAYARAVLDARGKPNEALQALLRERDLNRFVFDRWRTFLADAKPAAVTAAAEAVAKVAAAPENPTPAEAEAARWLAAGGPTDVPLSDFDKVQNRADRDALAAIKRKTDAFKASSPHAPPRAHVLNDSPAPTQPVVFLRGNPNNRGPQVPRQAPAVVAGAARKPFTDGSGRLELAKAIASPDNPLTARVLVNRVWAGHFGHGLVRTPSDFGVRSDPPSHPELLDWLAARFVADGWSLKKLHKTVMLSATYRRSSAVTAEAFRVDPENKLLSHQSRRRLDFEALRDSVLSAAGTLDLTLGGKAVDLFKAPFSTRRTVYGVVDRTSFPGTMRAFDVASPDQHSPQRFQTTAPQQALFLMNSPFATTQAKALASRPEVASAKSPAEKATALYRLALGRAPTKDELALAVEFAAGDDPAAAFGAWPQLAQVLLLSNEFAFAD